jgi:hypothetical protein
MYGAIDGTMNRPKEDKVKEEIIKLIFSSEKPLSTQEISESLDSPWHCIQNRCLVLQIEGKVNGLRVGRINLWTRKEVREDGK